MGGGAVWVSAAGEEILGSMSKYRGLFEGDVERAVAP